MKLTSRALKVGDWIIRKSPISETDHAFTYMPLKIVSKQNGFTEVISNSGVTHHIPHFIYNDNNWVRWKIKN